MQLLQALSDGLATGASYAVLALAFTVLWATVRTVNMAMLQLVAVSGIVAYYLAERGPVIAFLGGIAASTLVGLVTHYVAVRPTLAKGLIYPIIATFAVGLLITGAISLTFGDDLHTMPALLPSGTMKLGSVFFSWNSLIVLLITVVLLVVATLVMRYTRLGLAFRSSSWSPEIANVYGVNVGVVRFCSAAAAGALAGLAGVFAAVLAGSVSPVLGSAAGLKGIVAMLIGGAGNLPGAVIGGLAIGVIESMSAQFVSGTTSQIVSYAVLFLVMVASPSGLMKER